MMMRFCTMMKADSPYVPKGNPFLKLYAHLS